MKAIICNTLVQTIEYETAIKEFFQIISVITNSPTKTILRKSIHDDLPVLQELLIGLFEGYMTVSQLDSSGREFPYIILYVNF